MIRSGLLAAMTALVMQTTPAFAQVGGAGLLSMVGQGQYDKARTALGQVEHSQVDQLFLEAQIFAHQGRLDEAVTLYRAILAANPELVPVRQVLAQTLLNMGDFDAARFHFRTLMEAEANADLRVQYANALRIIDQQTPSGINASLAVIPSTNVNRGTYNTTIQTGALNFTIDPNSRQVSGVGLQFGLNGYWRTPVAPDAMVTLSAGASQTLYEADQFNITQPFVSAAYTKTGPKSTWTATAFANRALRNLGDDYTTFGLQYSARRQLEGPNTLSYSVLAQQTEYDTQPVQSGPLFSVDIGLQRQIDPTMALNGGVKLGRGLPEGDHLKYVSASVYGGVTKTWRGGWAGFTGLEFGARSYDANFTALTFEREDEFVNLRGSILNSTISYAGFAPRLNCTVQFNSSNVAFYDYNATECSFELTRGF